MGRGWVYDMDAGMWTAWIVLALVVALVGLLIVRASEPRSRSSDPTDRGTAREILADRHARGEIGTEAHEERRRLLSS